MINSHRYRGSGTRSNQTDHSMIEHDGCSPEPPKKFV